jgi:hypothetical protein
MTLSICRVIARVYLAPGFPKLVDDSYSQGIPGWLASPNQDDLALTVSLAAEDSRGGIIDAPVCFGIAGPRTGLGAARCRYHPACLKAPNHYHVCELDIRESIDQMLGRDPELHRPPRLAWENLVAALQARRHSVAVDQLQALPLTVVLEQAVKEELQIAQNP